MSDLMFYGVLEMPYEMAMGDEISRLQFYSRVQEAVRRLKAAEAATEAAKPAAQDSAPAELPPLPNPVGAVEWAPSIREFKIEPAYTTGQMREYGRQCAEAARQSLMQLFLDPENQPTQYGTVLAAQQPAPVAIKTWQERLREKFPETAERNLFAVGHLEHAMEAEIADLRAALAAAPASPQPVAKVLTDEEIFSIHASTNDSDSQIIAFARAILASASTPTTLTEKKE